MASRHFVAFLASLVLTPGAFACAGDGDSSTGAPASEATTPTSGLFARVDSLARARATSPYRSPSADLPGRLEAMTYDQYRAIRFRPERAIWRDTSLFEVQLFHPGYQYPEPVAIHVVDDEETGIGDGALAFDPDRFVYEGDADELAEAAAGTSPDLGYAGFRIHYPMNRPTLKDEVAVFLGASYFRLLGPGHVHGLSSRGLAVNAGLPDGEEFPDFREFWLVRPEPTDTTLVLFALLDGPSVTGAYRMELTPGVSGAADASPWAGEGRSVTIRPTVVDVDARLYARRDVEKLGVAPLSSMFLFDENNRADFDDVRLRVHDSHGLLAHTGRDEWIWRPLSNGPGLSVTALQDMDPRGFGLVQRVREFERYLDLEARYDRRPSQWVEVGAGDWGAGAVELMEIPSRSEFHDNIAAYWNPREPFQAGQRRWYRYRLITFDDRLPRQELGQVERTRIGWDALPGQADPPPRSRRLFVVDFGGGVLDPAEEGEGASAPSPPAAMIETLSGEISDRRVEPLPDGGWRVTFDLSPDGERPADMRLYLERDGRVLTETWSYVWDPNRVR